LLSTDNNNNNKRETASIVLASVCLFAAFNEGNKREDFALLVDGLSFACLLFQLEQSSAL
jgi:hypothetical protein